MFLKSPERVEALVGLLQIALTAYQLLERLYRQAVPAKAPAAEKRLTTESILRAFRVCSVVNERTPPASHPGQARLPTPIQLLSARLPRPPC